MALKKIKLGDYLIPYKEKCGISNLTPYEISGINRDKEFFEPSRQTGEDTTNYQNVPPKYFACNLMHVGRDMVLPIAYNHTDEIKHVSPAYTIFCLKDNSDLLDYYFFIFLKSSERDRFFWFNTDGSVRDGMSWDDLCKVALEVPPLSIQQKYVDVYNAMLENQKSYERGLDDLKLVCDAYIDKLRNELPLRKLAPYISISEFHNEDLKYGIDDVRGISIEKKFIDTKADMQGVSLKPYAVVNPNEFAYVTVTSRNGEKISLARNDNDSPYICSSSYIVFKVADKSCLMPEYLSILFERDEFNRYARFNSWGSARETFDWTEMCDVKIPIPEYNIQKSIVDIYKTYNTRKSINERLKTQIKDICPILIKGSIEEAMEVENVHTAV